VLEQGLAQCRAWHDAGCMLGLQVNLSTRTLHDQQMPDMVARLLQHHQLAPQWLTLEITESALMADPAGAQEVLTRLAALGVKLAIDDFGTGYSSLGYLKHLPVHEVKIDKSFVLRMDQDERDAAIVRSVVVMAHALGLGVVAEGVETSRAYTLLQALGCDVAQGYYLSRPLPPADLAHWVATSPYGPDRLSA
jgi:EAL domain-containing protein (putative c-di-GMP-specific phosphodiesterase class I)